MLQKAMNLTTVRTHQYAVWITIGFFEVKRQGDLQMAGAGAGTAAATLAFDILGPEIGASTGQTTRYRGFFLVAELDLDRPRGYVLLGRKTTKKGWVQPTRGKPRAFGGLHPPYEDRHDALAIDR
jgi:hypothetical protein